ncbi:hypothetical protein QJQ45_007535 [Haematococcus lacustris]|nr:hypothetical protein QJQ45_007535 [Haematococcus lacustris]
MRTLLSDKLTVLRQHLQPGTEEFAMLLSPIITYWVVALFYDWLDTSRRAFVLKHKVARKDVGRANQVGRGALVARVLLQQLLQSLLAVLVILVDPEQCTTCSKPRSLLQHALQFVIGMFVMDAWQYWIHRGMHVSTYLYQNFHSVHHQMYIPYAIGALYNHPIEAMLLDTVGAGVSMFATGMSCRTATIFFSFSTAKTVFDHCGYVWPLNPMHNLFPNSAAYHDVHHDIRGIKKNFSQPYFTFWDHLCGTYLDPSQFHLTQQELNSKVDADLAASKLPLPSSASKPALGQPSSDKPSSADSSTTAAVEVIQAVVQAEAQPGHLQGSDSDGSTGTAVSGRLSSGAAEPPTQLMPGLQQAQGVVTRSRGRKAQASQQ